MPGIIAVIIMIVGALLTSHGDRPRVRERHHGDHPRRCPCGRASFSWARRSPISSSRSSTCCVGDPHGPGALRGGHEGELLADDPRLDRSTSWWRLSIGLLISIKTQSQLVANQVAVLVTYLPSLLLSDFVFPQQQHAGGPPGASPSSCRPPTTSTS
ncbi:MAG: hypothetical protein MZW92_21770 [Comamonadaceae bacterium]|nr:hypothetical protein [Comamonadaceae bacterium]